MSSSSGGGAAAASAAPTPNGRQQQPQEPSSSSSVVLFYKYFLPSDFGTLHAHAAHYEPLLAARLKELCCGLKGRLLVAARDGINGTLSSLRPETLQAFIQAMEDFELMEQCGPPPVKDDEGSNETLAPEYLFRGVDWKLSVSKGAAVEPFPDLKISVVKEIISTGGSVSVAEIPTLGGTHLSPTEFHDVILQNHNVVLIDVRNTFEYDIGHFVNPHTNDKALNPETVTFSSFEDTFCARQADALRDKKVLMYCTGGIRCEKASVMLKRRGVEDVSQLQGGIHRYLEEYGEDGLFRGLNFVFDQRVDQQQQQHETTTTSREIVGRCIECTAPFDEISGSRICTVCRDLVLVCPDCRAQLREYHCKRHQTWKTCYFTFLDTFDRDELQGQHQQLGQLRDSSYPKAKNVRKTLFRQMEKVQCRMDQLDKGTVVVNKMAPRRCRSCMETSDVCNGLCWGFWKSRQNGTLQKALEPLLPIQTGDVVEPGPHWNTLRYGPTTTETKTNTNTAPETKRRGTVVELKPWGTGGDANDCVLVEWDDDDDDDNPRRKKSQPYRWGVVGGNGARLYDVQTVDSSETTR